MTPTEQSFLAMAKLAGASFRSITPVSNVRFITLDGRTALSYLDTDDVSAMATVIANNPDIFPIMASTFEAVVGERPSLLALYEKARHMNNAP